jgi:hypothetical protein
LSPDRLYEAGVDDLSILSDNGRLLEQKIFPVRSGRANDRIMHFQLHGQLENHVIVQRENAGVHSGIYETQDLIPHDAGRALDA